MNAFDVCAVGWTSLGPMGGAPSGLVINPKTSSVAYAPTRGGGVFKTTDSATRWAPSNAGLTSLDVSAVVIDPVSTGTLYAATTAGIERSTNAAVTWNLTAFPQAPASAVAVDAAAPNRVFAGGNGTVCRSIDKGLTWPQCGTGVPNQPIIAIVVGNGKVWVATSGGGVHVSTNDGLTFQARNDGLSVLTLTALVNDAVTSTILYAATLGGGVFRSTDDGDHWTAFNQGLDQPDVFALTVVDPSPSNSGNVSRLYAGTATGVFHHANDTLGWEQSVDGLSGLPALAIGVDSKAPSTVLVGTNHGIFRSTNSGNSWTSRAMGFAHRHVSSLTFDPGSSSTLYLGTTGDGVFRTIDAGNAWAARSNGLPSRTVTALVVDPAAPLVLYAATAAGLAKSTDLGLTWNSTGLTRGDIQTLLVVPGAGLIYAGGTDGIRKSSNGGTSWNTANSGLTSPMVHVLAADPTNAAVVYAGTIDGAFKTTNNGSTWAPLAGSGTDVVSLVVDPSDAQVLYALTNAGVLRSTDGGTSWITRTTGLPQSGLRLLAIDPSAPSTLFLGTATGVFTTVNSGTTWAPNSDGLPNAPLTALALTGTGGHRTAYAGTAGNGVFSTDLTHCTSSTDCNDNSLCTPTDRCDPTALDADLRGCVHTRIACVPTDQCHAAGVCDPTTGDCSNPTQANGLRCSDTDACTKNDTCQGGVCVPGLPTNCADNNPCTADTCDHVDGCVHAPLSNGVICSDNNACTENDACLEGVCHGATKLCPAPNQCYLAGLCNSATGQCSLVVKPSGSSCDDDNACTTNDKCQNGTCVPGSQVNCSDGNPCTDGTCIAGTGCVYANNFRACSDGNRCTKNDACDGEGHCQPGFPLVCDDGKGCTIDVCSPVDGCVFTPDPDDPTCTTTTTTSPPRNTTTTVPNPCTTTDECVLSTPCATPICQAGVCRSQDVAGFAGFDCRLAYLIEHPLCVREEIDPSAAGKVYSRLVRARKLFQQAWLHAKRTKVGRLLYRVSRLMQAARKSTARGLTSGNVAARCATQLDHSFGGMQQEARGLTTP